MSSEILPVLDGSEASSAEHETGTKDDIPSFDLFKFRGVTRGNLISYSHEMRHFISPEKGHRYVTQSDPTPYSLKSLLEKMKEPSVLLLQGCDQLLLPTSDFPFHKFTTLTALEISNISHLTTLPDKTISQMKFLQTLNLSHLPIRQLPGDFFSSLTNLRSLVLKGCSKLYSLPEIPYLFLLECLDLSFLLIEALPEKFFYSFPVIRWLILRGCSKLRSLPEILLRLQLEVVDLSHCTALRKLGSDFLLCDCLTMLDLSYTALPKMPKLPHRHQGNNLTHLYFRDTKATKFVFGRSVSNLEVLDLSGAQYVRRIDGLQDSQYLVALDLSRTHMKSVDFISNLIHLRSLILRECHRLVRLPAMEKLTNLEVLDISGCEKLGDLPEDLTGLRNLKELNLSRCSIIKLRVGLFDKMSSLEKLDLSQTTVDHLPSVSNLINLQILNLSQTSVAKLPDISKLVNLKELLLANCQELEVLPDVQALTNLETLDLSLPDDCTINSLQAEVELHDQRAQFLSAPSRLRKLLLANRPGVLKLFPQVALRNSEHLDLEAAVWDGDIHPGLVQRKTSKSDEFHLVSTFFNSSGFDNFRYEFTDLEDLISTILKKFISASPDTVVATTKGNIQNEVFKRQSGSVCADLTYILKNITLLESSHNCKSTEELLLKLFDVANHLSAVESPLDYTKLNELLRVVAKLKLLIPRRQVDDSDDDTEEEIDLDVEYNDFTYLEEEEIQESYDSLTKSERDCLFCFAVFPYGADEYSDDNTQQILKRFNIKKRILVQWWFGEGFIDPQHEENFDSTPSRVLRHENFEEIGRQILKVLFEKKFVVPVIKKNWGTGSWCMLPEVHSFVTQRAMEEGFFDLHHENHKLTPHLSGSKRACLLKSQDNYQSSCRLWDNFTSSSEKLERFKAIRTLINVNEPMIDVKAKWFSKMRNLSVLHLGNLGFNNVTHIEVMDLNFLEELKNMRQMRLLSLEGFSTMKKLPDSVCKLGNLRILNLRDCGYLEELPADIGSLQNLIHLDLTDSRALSKLPKGIRLLSKLEVLKGFVISYQLGGQQHRKACTLEDLLTLQSLGKLNLVVNRDEFPDNKDLQVFKEMKNLFNLKITWEKSYDEDQETRDVVGHDASRHSGWRKLKCWELQTRQKDTEEELLRNSHFDNLRKLVLCCFPLKRAPNWLYPGKLENLVKLYIFGGNLKRLPGDTDQNTWNVEILRLMYLKKLKADWEGVRGIFSSMTLFQQKSCYGIENCDFDVWANGEENEDEDENEDV